MRVEIRFRTTEAFEQDTKLFGFSEGDVGTLKRNLRTNPFLGEADTRDPLMRRYGLQGHVVTYRIIEPTVAEDVAIVWLLILRPEEKPKADLTGKAQKAIDTYIKLRRLFRGGSGNDG